MSKSSIQIYEHGKLSLGGDFKPHHLKALLKLNELHSFNYLEATANGVKFKNYVGIVQVDNLTIEILPKIDNQGDDVDKWRKVLLDMLSIAKKIKAHNTDHADVLKRRHNLLEIYLQMFLSEVDGLIRRGLCKQYRIERSNVLALKGKLEIAGHIRENLVHKERFYTSHQVYDQDHLIHQILRKAIQIVVGFSRQSYLAAFASRVDLAFPDIVSESINVKSFDKVHLTRKTAPYKKALELAKIIIENYSPRIHSGSVNMIALLFNMDALWEEYIYQSLRKESATLEIKVSKDNKSLFEEGGYYLKPDLLLEKQNKKYIIDTKWKIPANEKASSQDLRQIYAYNRFWKADKGILLYPGKVKSSPFYKYDDKDNNHQCRLAYLDVIDEGGKLKSNIGQEILKLLKC